jgi:regulator of protease activity HflC (stomatin/prohibitin superfamily)
MKKVLYLTSGFFLFCIILLIIILLSLTVNKRVEQDEYGITINKFTTQIGPLLEQGSHTLAVGDKFIIIKSIFIHREYDFVCMTYDKLLIDISISFQYQYIKNRIIEEIFYKFGDENKFLIYMDAAVQSSVYSTCGNYHAEDFYVSRGSIENQMMIDMKVNMNKFDIGIDINLIQLKNVNLPTEFTTSITNKQLIDQNIVTQTNQRTSEIINANTILYQSKINYDISIINANNTAKIILQTAQINKDIEIYNWNQKAISILNIMTNLNLNSTQLCEYIELELMKNSKNSYIIMDV